MRRIPVCWEARCSATRMAGQPSPGAELQIPDAGDGRAEAIDVSGRQATDPVEDLVFPDGTEA